MASAAIAARTARASGRSGRRGITPAAAALKAARGHHALNLIFITPRARYRFITVKNKVFKFIIAFHAPELINGHVISPPVSVFLFHPLMNS